MTNITLSIEDETYKKMKNYSEIKWSAFVRMCIQRRIKELQKIEVSAWENTKFLGDEKLLAESWLSKEDEEEFAYLQ